MKNADNIFEGINVSAAGEEFTELLRHKNVRIERIVSSDVIPEKIYKQDHDEWVVVLDGRAELDIDGLKRTVSRGDYLFIESGVSHRVLAVARGTVWLAIHID